MNFQQIPPLSTRELFLSNLFVISSSYFSYIFKEALKTQNLSEIQLRLIRKCFNCKMTSKNNIGIVVDHLQGDFHQNIIPLIGPDF